MLWERSFPRFGRELLFVRSRWPPRPPFVAPSCRPWAEATGIASAPHSSASDMLRRILFIGLCQLMVDKIICSIDWRDYCLKGLTVITIK